jgi:signal transduction histidine kinase/DNA-binding response OmpR family regulator/PAS domain-containing protein
VFATGEAIVDGPYTDSRGTWLTAVVPIEGVQRADGQRLLLGIDMDAGEREARLRAAVRPWCVLTLGVLGVLAIGAVLLFLCRRCSPVCGKWRHLYEPSLAFLVVCLVSVGVAMMLHEREVLRSRHLAEALARQNSQQVANLLRHLRDFDLGAFSAFLDAVDVLRPDAFRIFSRSMLVSGAASSWAWAPIVTQDEREGFLARQREWLGEDFEIWEGKTEAREPATGRPFYLPILYLEPAGEHLAGIHGFDFASEKTRHEAVRQAMLTRLPVVSKPVVIVNESDTNPELRLCHPVYAEKNNQLVGFLLSILDSKRLLSAQHHGYVRVGLILNGADPLWLASSGAGRPFAGDVQQTYVPFLNAVFVIENYGVPGVGRVRRIGAASVYILVAGFLLSLLISGTLFVVLSGKAALQRLVETQTEALQASHARFGALLDSMEEMVFLKDAGMRYVYCNEGLTAFFRKPAEGIYGKKDQQLMGDAAAARCEESDRQALLSERPVISEEDIGGRIFETHKFQVEMGDGSVGIGGYIADVTERNEAQAAFRKLAEMQRLLTQTASEYISLPLERLDDAIDRSLAELGRFLGADRGYVFSYDHVGRFCTNTHEWCAPGISAQKDQLQELSFDRIPVWVARHVQHEIIHLPQISAMDPSSSLYAVLDGQGIRSLIAIPIFCDSTCAGCLGFDFVVGERTCSSEEQALLVVFAKMLGHIWQRADMETALAESREAAESASRAKSAFLANMSHEIRTPMNGVMGMLDLLRHADLDEQYAGFVDAAYSSADSLLRLINDILDVSKIEAGKLDLESIAFDLEPFVANLLPPLALKAQEKGVDCVCMVDPALPQAFTGDPVRIRQIVVNLLGNAIKFTSEGAVVLSVEPCSGEEYGKPRMRLRVTVRDTGIGIAEEKHHLLFQPFSQGDASTTRQYGGTGLGLVIVRQLAELMKGTVGFTSYPGQGSVFWVELELPVAASAEFPSPVVAKPQADALLGKQVLLLDTHAESRAAIARILSYAGASVQEAMAADQAKALLAGQAEQRVHFDAVLVDAEVADGIAVVHGIRADRRYDAARILLLVPIRGQVIAEEVAGLKDVHLLTKPVCRFRLLPQLLRDDPETGQEGDTSADSDALLVQKSAAPDFSAKERIHLLLVEDNRTNQVVARAILEILGITCEVAVNGRKALEQVQQSRFDAVLMDVQMPEMDGYEATKAMRLLPEPLRAIPIIAMTANAMPGDRERCLDAGMSDYLAKPLSVQDVQDVLRRWLPHMA